MTYRCPECGYEQSRGGECPMCFDATGAIVSLAEKITVAKIAVGNHKFETSTCK